jgi:hypothetical protein
MTASVLWPVEVSMAISRFLTGWCQATNKSGIALYGIR